MTWLLCAVLPVIVVNKAGRLAGASQRFLPRAGVLKTVGTQCWDSNDTNDLIFVGVQLSEALLPQELDF